MRGLRKWRENTRSLKVYIFVYRVNVRVAGKDMQFNYKASWWGAATKESTFTVVVGGSEGTDADNEFRGDLLEYIMDGRYIYQLTSCYSLIFVSSIQRLKNITTIQISAYILLGDPYSFVNHISIQIFAYILLVISSSFVNHISVKSSTSKIR